MEVSVGEKRVLRQPICLGICCCNTASAMR
jgi:hypothetical protein